MRTTDANRGRPPISHQPSQQPPTPSKMAPAAPATFVAVDAVSSDEHNVTIGADLNASRSPLDKKLYRHITLPNGLQAVLIQDTIAMAQKQSQENDDDDDDDDEDASDASSEMGEQDDDDDEEMVDVQDQDGGAPQGGLRDAACCILVGAGSASDPKTCPGLAHFLEHLLFMGSEKYPLENEYDAYVSKHGGSDNAWTEWEYTAYSLEIPAKALWGAIDRLAQFFIEPLLLPSAVDRELKAIESEFQLNKNSDATRKAQLICSCGDPDHPMAKFSWGNQFSLSDVPARKGVDRMVELRQFFCRHYYGKNMRLVIQGAYTLDELQDGITEYFSSVPMHPRDASPPDQQKKAMQAAGFPLPPHTLGTITRVVPVRERHSVCVTWQIPSQLPHWKSKPTDFLAHLLGHEASGSLLSYCRDMSWATSCMAGCGDEGSENSTSHALFSVTFILSESGLAHWREVVEAVYQYIGMLRKQSAEGWPPYIYDELRQMHELSYRYGDEASPDQTCEHLIEDMGPHNYLPVERLLDGNSLLFEFDEVVVQSLLDDYLLPRNARIDLTSSSFGKPLDFENIVAGETSTETTVSNLIIKDESADGTFDVSTAEDPQVDPMFTTQFWCRKLSDAWLDQLTLAAEPGAPAIETLQLPPRNPYVPQKFDLAPLPDDDADHPLLNASLKVCISVGKTKQWFPATVVRYNRMTNAVLLSFEDEDEKWYTLDLAATDFSQETLLRWDAFEGSMDSKSVKYRVVALSVVPGAKGAGIRKFGDESDFDVDDGISFPPIPPPSSRLPVEISNTNVLKMFWLQDWNFKRPIAEFRLQFVCARANASPLHRAAADLLRSLCVDSLLESAYLAEMCELGSSIDATDTGFELRFHGFDDKLLDLCLRTTNVLLSFRGRDTLPDGIKEDRFAACLETLLRRYNNSGMTASSMTSSTRLQAMRPTIRSSNQKLVALEGISIGLFCKTVSSILEDFACEAFLHGNADRSRADEARDLIVSVLQTTGCAGLPREKYPAVSVLKIPSVREHTLLTVPSKDPDEPNTACEVYVQIGKDDIRTRTINDLLLHMMEEPIYDQLRTKDQLGYDVHCDVRWSYGIIGSIFHVTTNVKSAPDVVARIDQFLTDFRQELVDMSKADYHEHLVGLAKQKLTMFNSLSEETACLWAEIRDGRYEWEAWRNETVCLRGLQKDDILEAYDSWLLPGQRRNILVIQVIGAAGDTDASLGRPVVEPDRVVGEFVDDQVASFHKLCQNQTWGRVNSKLF